MTLLQNKCYYKGPGPTSWKPLK